MHTHSEHSHDSTCPIREMARKQQERGMYGFAVTDHCDLFSYEQGNVAMNIQKSVAEVRALCEDEEKERASIENTRKIHILSGVELGESIWYPDVEEQVIHMCDYDVVIGSVHTVRYKEYDMPYSCIDFSEMDTKEIYGYLNGYFDDVLQMVQSNPCDVVAHLAYPLRYINGKYGLGIDCKRFEEKIRKILSAIIQRGIALEVNTSCMCEDDIDWLNQDWLLGIYREIGGLLITLGSDAHISENAAREFDRAVALLRKHGFRNCFYYEKRKSIQCTI